MPTGAALVHLTEYCSQAGVPPEALSETWNNHSTLPESEMRCHLLELPPELRLHIYEAYFGETRSCYVDNSYDRTTGATEWETRWRIGGDTGSAMLRTCRKIHAEAYPILLERTKLYIGKVYDDDAGGYSSYTDSTPLPSLDSCSFISAIQDIHLDLGESDCPCDNCHETHLQWYRVWEGIHGALSRGRVEKKLTVTIAIGNTCILREVAWLARLLQDKGTEWLITIEENDRENMEEPDDDEDVDHDEGGAEE
jgi:hypothetical protein